jgi:selenocysteine-specific translation elongation factor
MRNVGIAVIDLKFETAGKLGKKGTASDYTIYNRKSDESVLCFYEPSMYPDKLVSLLHCLNSSDFALLVFDGISRETGETIVALDAIGMSGIVAFRGGTKEDLLRLAKGTVVEKYWECEYDVAALLSKCESLSPSRDSLGPVRIPVDSAFVVKSVGLVVLGIVKSGTVKIHDELTALPSGKKSIVRSIQVQDKDVRETSAGDRAGLCLKNIELEDLDRGVELAKEGGLVGATEISAEVEVNKFQKSGISNGASLFVSRGMQYSTVKISGEVNPGEKKAVKLSFQKPFVCKKGDVAILADNGRPLRIVGRARF